MNASVVIVSSVTIDAAFSLGRFATVTTTVMTAPMKIMLLFVLRNLDRAILTRNTRVLTTTVSPENLSAIST